MILHLLSSNKLSGAENVAADICMMFKNERNMIYCSPKGNILEDLENRNVKFVPIKSFTYRNIKKIIRKYNPNIIHAHDVKASVFASMIRSSAHVISHLHGNDERMRKLSIKSYLYRIASKKISKIIAVSDSVFQDYKYKEKIAHKSIVLVNIIYPARIDLLKNSTIETKSFDFLYLGRLTYPKDPVRVAIIAASVLLELKDIRFGIVGNGDYINKMKDVFKLHNVSDRVTFTGNIRNPYAVLESTKCLVMASRYEGMPIVALEAMYLGVPIISTPTDGLKDIIINDYNGLTSTDNDILVNNIIRILKDNVYQRKLSLNSKKEFMRINRYQDYKDTLHNIYGEIDIMK